MATDVTANLSSLPNEIWNVSIEIVKRKTRLYVQGPHYFKNVVIVKKVDYEKKLRK